MISPRPAGKKGGEYVQFDLSRESGACTRRRAAPVTPEQRREWKNAFTAKFASKGESLW